MPKAWRHFPEELCSVWVTLSWGVESAFWQDQAPAVKQTRGCPLVGLGLIWVSLLTEEILAGLIPYVMLEDLERKLTSFFRLSAISWQKPPLYLSKAIFPVSIYQKKDTFGEQNKIKLHGFQLYLQAKVYYALMTCKLVASCKAEELSKIKLHRL